MINDWKRRCYFTQLGATAWEAPNLSHSLTTKYLYMRLYCVYMHAC